MKLYLKNVVIIVTRAFFFSYADLLKTMKLYLLLKAIVHMNNRPMGHIAHLCLIIKKLELIHKICNIDL